MVQSWNLLGFDPARYDPIEAAPDDIKIAEVEEGPVIVARPGKPKVVVIGFHPAHSAMRYELTTPLLFANMLRWIAPDIFRRRQSNSVAAAGRCRAGSIASTLASAPSGAWASSHVTTLPN